MTANDPNAENPPWSDILKAAIRTELAKMRIEIPGRIVEYDSAEQNATVQPVVRSSYRDADTDERETYLPEPIANVPVRFPQGHDDSGNLYAIVWPLSPDDWVTLEFQSRSLDEWLSTGQADVTPEDLRRFDLSDCIAVPGPSPLADPLPPDAIEDTALVMSAPEIHGGKANPQNFAARDDRVESELKEFRTVLNSFIDAFDTHSHPSHGSPPSNAGTVTKKTAIDDVAADKVRIE